MADKAGKLPWRTKLVYGVGTIAFGIKDHGFNALLMIYYNQVMGLPAAWVGAAIMIAMVADAILDPVVGQWSDSLRSKWGRRHPFMYASVLPVGIFYLLLWFPPAEASYTVLFAYLLILTTITRTFIGIYEIPSTALLAEFTQNYHERTELVSYRYFFGVAGGILMGIFVFTVIFSPEAASAGGLLDSAGYHTYAWIAAPLMATAIFASSLGTHSRISSLLTPPPPERKPFLQTIREMFATLFHRVNAPIFIGSIFGSMAGGLNAALTIYMQTYFWELTSDQIAVLTSAGLLGVVLALVIALPLSRTFGKKWTTLTLFAVTLTGIVVPVLLRLGGLFPENGNSALLPSLFLFQAVVAMSVVAAAILTASMIADATDQIQLTTGRQSEGLLFSAATFIGKTVSGMGVLVSGLLLTLVGFPNDAKPGAVDLTTVNDLALALTVATFIFTSAALIIMSFYPVSKQDHERAVETLARKRAEQL
ncbi:MFS transporter [Hyphomonas sp.]|uniref:MFS transporter n=1 Tax=Hyphomonas sp. TaxID=87 RepID=UPI0025C48B8B|nr:MFS transporter [Hyphomonas sp.]